MARGDAPRQLPALFELRKSKKFQNESRESVKNKSKSGYVHQGVMLENQETFSSPGGRFRGQIPRGAEPPPLDDL